MTKRMLFSALLSLAFSPTALAISSSETLLSRCDGMYQFTDLDHAVEPGVVVAGSEGSPAYCRVRGVIDGTIRFEVTMPLEGWKGRLMFHALGGSAGRIGDTTSLLGEGFAMASTDTGHETDPVEGDAFFRDQNALINFGSRGIRLTTLAAKRVIAAFYDDEIDHAYIWGCSTGGRAGLEEALRYPDDYDGVIAGAPAPGWASELLSWSLAGARAQQANPLTLESLDLLDANSRTRCDLLDDVADGVIGRPDLCTTEALELEALLCDDAQTKDCLTQGQLETVRFMYEGITDESGRVVSHGVSPGAESLGDWMLWVTGNPDFMPVSAQVGSSAIIEHLLHRTPGFNLDNFDVVNDRHLLAEAAASAELPRGNFTQFRESGGKLIVYNGWSDVPIRANRTLAYMADAAQLSGGPGKMAEFSRVYMVPGMLHCAGGPGAWAADYLGPMIEWVEEGKAPSRIIATHPGITNWFEAAAAMQESADWHTRVIRAGAKKGGINQFTRPLCPYPQHAQYAGSGDVNDAVNFTCAEE